MRFSGGAGRPGSVGAVTLEGGEQREVTRWSTGEGELPAALAAPIWGRYGRFRGHPRITGLVAWHARTRQVLVTGTRGDKHFDEVLVEAPARRAVLPRRDTSPSWPQAAASLEGTASTAPEPRGAAAPVHDTSRDTSPPDVPRTLGRACRQCGQPIPAGARPEARYCSKRCRQAASRARLRERSGRAVLRPPERCGLCHGPMPTGVRPEARYCSKRCRQSASRRRPALARASGKRARRADRAGEAARRVSLHARATRRSRRIEGCEPAVVPNRSPELPPRRSQPQPPPWGRGALLRGSPAGMDAGGTRHGGRPGACCRVRRQGRRRRQANGLGQPHHVVPGLRSEPVRATEVHAGVSALVMRPWRR